MDYDKKAYSEEVKVVAKLLAERRFLERGGKVHEGWMDANFALQRELKRASAMFPGMDLDIIDDGYRQMVVNYHGRG